MSIQSGSKLKNARPGASISASPIAPASTVNEISLLERVSILASILLSLKQSVGSTAAAGGHRGGGRRQDGPSSETGAAGEVVIGPPQAIEIARLPEWLSTDSPRPRRAQIPQGSPSTVWRRRQVPIRLRSLAPPADALLKPIARHGLDVPSVLKIDVDR